MSEEFQPCNEACAAGASCPARGCEQKSVGLLHEQKGWVTITIQGTREDGQQITSVRRVIEPNDILSLPHRAEQLARVFHNQFTA